MAQDAPAPTTGPALFPLSLLAWGAREEPCHKDEWPDQAASKSLLNPPSFNGSNGQEAPQGKALVSLPLKVGLGWWVARQVPLPLGTPVSLLGPLNRKLGLFVGVQVATGNMEEPRCLPEVRWGDGGHRAKSWGPWQGGFLPERWAELTPAKGLVPGLFFPMDATPWADWPLAWWGY